MRYQRWPRRAEADPLLHKLADAAQVHPCVVYHNAQKMLSLLREAD